MDYKLKSSGGSSSVVATNGNGLGFSIFPVPSNDGKVTVEVNSNKLKPLHFTITDMTGRVIAKFEEKHSAKTSSHDFDFSALSNGNYQMHISNEEETMSGKFTISK